MRRNMFASLLSSAGLLLGVSCADPECEKGEFKVANICRKLPVTDSSVGAASTSDAGAESIGSTQNPRRDSSVVSPEGQKDASPADVTSDASPSNPDDTAVDGGTNAAQPANDASGSPAPACAATTEVCDGSDNDCDGEIDEAVKNRCWPDGDGDGFAAAKSTAVEQCEPCGAKQTAVEPTAATNTDCADSDAKRAPSLGDVCGDKIDNDCDGVPDDDANNVCGGPCTAQLIGQPNEPCSNKLLGECARMGTYQCQADGTIKCTAEVVTGRAEDCDGKDNDCDGEVDEGAKNACGKCGAVPTEACDGVDNDCDGIVDDGLTNACGGPCGQPVPSENCFTPADDNCNGRANEDCPVCGDRRVQAPEECDPTAMGWSEWTCNAECKRETMYAPCATDADCFGVVRAKSVICHIEYGVCSISCADANLGLTGEASGCPKPPGALVASCIELPSNVQGMCTATTCTRQQDCAVGSSCVGSGTISMCLGCDRSSVCPSGTTCVSNGGSFGQCK